jgi:NADH-quinone oxidoreductase subunit H
MITTSFLAVAVFFGGWHLSGLATPGMTGVGTAIVKLIVFGVKMFLFIVFFMWIRWTLPRFRFDQLMGLAWKVLLPLALVSFVCVLVVQHFRPLGDLSDWLLLPLSIAVLVGAGWLTLYLPREAAKVQARPRGEDRGHPVLTAEQIGPPQ